MAKTITASELSIIISGLLNDPSGMGALDDNDTYNAFMTDAAQLVANYCGGDLGIVSEPMPFDGSNFNNQAAIAVYPNDSLPGLTHTIWGAFDTESEDEPCTDHCSHNAHIFKGLFRNWDADETEPGDLVALHQYDVEVTHQTADDQLSIEMLRDGEPALSVVVEVSNNYPKVHIGTGIGDDLLMHIACVDQELIVAHESYIHTETCRNIHTYNDSGYSIKHG